MTIYDDFLASSTSLRGISGILVDDLSGLLDQDVLRGENDIIDGAPGEQGVTLVRAAYDFAIPFNLKATTLPGLYAAITTVRAMFTLAPQTFTRRRSKTASPFYEDHTCNGQYRGLVWNDAGPDSMKSLDIGGTLLLRNLDGSWS
jgi:hypothetical protein